MRTVNRRLMLGLLVFASLSASSAEPDLKALYNQHRWFELREAIKGRHVPPLYKGAVASAFDDTTSAEKYLNEAIKFESGSESARDAHETLANFYARRGKYREAVQQLDEILKIKPDSPDAVNALAIFGAWSKHGDQSVQSAAWTRFHGDVSKDGVRLPVSIHGKTVHWLLDTGANLSLISEDEAKSLGVQIDDSTGSVSDSVGGSTNVRTAVVDELTIGRTQLRNVGFLILPDAQEPMSDWKLGERGIIGIPVAIALQSVAWESNGTVETGPRENGSAPGSQNLSFDDLNPVTRAEFEGKEVDLSLDTGDQSGTQLWSRFAVDFAALVKQAGTKSKDTVTQIGGARASDTTVLPEIRLKIGGMETMLQPAQIFPKPVGDDFHHGLLGMDLLSQARRVVIDFATMELKLLP